MTIAADVEVLPNVILMGRTAIGEDSLIGPNPRRGHEHGVRAHEDAVLDDGGVLVGPVVVARDGASADGTF